MLLLMLLMGQSVLAVHAVVKVKLRWSVSHCIVVMKWLALVHLNSSCGLVLSLDPLLEQILDFSLHFQLILCFLLLHKCKLCGGLLKL